jgi:cob(I)alamin adenosyltransferase
MVTLNRIYTRTGDDGTTGLVGNERRSKSDSRIEAIGAVDEVNAALGLTRQQTKSIAAIDAMLARIQNDLFDIGADLATPSSDTAAPPALRISDRQIERLEAEIDQLNAELAPLRSFVLPGGSAASAALHFARTLARRAERSTFRLAEEEEASLAVGRYLNRLSDLLFVMARWANNRGGDDVLWVPGGNR